jgi:hypothetical protein
MDEPLSGFLWEYKIITSNKSDTTVSQNNAELYELPFDPSTRLWIPLTDQRNEIKHLYVSSLTDSFGTSSCVDAHIQSRG